MQILSYFQKFNSFQHWRIPFSNINILSWTKIIMQCPVLFLWGPTFDWDKNVRNWNGIKTIRDSFHGGASSLWSKNFRRKCYRKCDEIQIQEVSRDVSIEGASFCKKFVLLTQIKLNQCLAKDELVKKHTGLRTYLVKKNSWILLRFTVKAVHPFQN